MSQVTYPPDTNVLVQGNFTARSMTLPTACVGDGQVQTGADVAAEKLIHIHAIPYNAQVPGSAIVAATVDLHIAKAAGNLMSLEAAITGAIATGADRTVTIDLHKSTGAGVFATVLSATIVFTNVSVIRTRSTATISSAAFIDADIFRLIVTVAGAAGAQAQGLIVTLRFNQKAQ